MLEKIPAHHLNEFLRNQTAFIKKRIGLLGVTSIGLYLLVSVLSLVFYPQDFKAQEIPAVFILIGSGVIILFLNSRTNRLAAARLNAYLFIALILSVITYVNIIYYEYAQLSAPIYAFILFLVSFMIPWMPLDIVIISVMHVVSYTLFFLYLERCLPQQPRPILAFQSYFDGVIFICAAFLICFIIRRKEAFRDIENFVLMKDLESKNYQINRELELATKVHKTLVPKSMSTDLVDIAVMYLPVSYLGGDYARFHFIDKDRLIFIICDVTGHGVSAALLVNRIHAEFERLSKNGHEPGALLKELGDFISKDFDGTNMYLSAFCGLLDFKNMKFAYSNHGHPTQYLYRLKESKIVYFSSQTALLGLPLEDDKVYQHEIGFEKMDKLLLFTDGVIETMNKDREQFGRERVESFIKENYELQADLFNQKLLGALTTFKTEKFDDDIFLLTMEIK